MKKKAEKNKKKSVSKIIFGVILAFMIGILVSMGYFQGITMQEKDMEPTLMVGSKYFINKVAYYYGNPKKGDIIVFRTSDDKKGALHIRRVIATPSETLQILNGIVYVNGKALKETYPKIKNPGNCFNEQALNKDEYFVLGDNRNNSDDSRHGDMGFINRKNIVGKIWLRFYPKREAKIF